MNVTRKLRFQGRHRIGAVEVPRVEVYMVLQENLSSVTSCFYPSRQYQYREYIVYSPRTIYEQYITSQ